ncbi:hypothetical protein [Chromobacterium sphagni]|uniref:BMC domain-containing protein n=1 Tax=Chromobacterium sphagni TaxID=1903179 RepID=A0ABX3CG57_9NEIS|nr:hypothetical protein [Chromobacterium sphagni]OHX21219.1 hypothetical protein BI344_01380 [Chromobacterium sphagni]
MSKLTDLFGWPNTTLVDVFEEAKSIQGNQLEIVEMELTGGGSLAIALISGPHTEAVTRAMRKAKGE